jgi:hypothetical protein
VRRSPRRTRATRGVVKVLPNPLIECGHDDLRRQHITGTTSVRRGGWTVSSDIAAPDQNGGRRKGQQAGRKLRVVQVPLRPGQGKSEHAQSATNGSPSVLDPWTPLEVDQFEQLRPVQEMSPRSPRPMRKAGNRRRARWRLFDPNPREIQHQHAGQDTREGRPRPLVLRRPLPDHLPPDLIGHLEHRAGADRQEECR